MSGGGNIILQCCVLYLLGVFREMYTCTTMDCFVLIGGSVRGGNIYTCNTVMVCFVLGGRVWGGYTKYYYGVFLLGGSVWGGYVPVRRALCVPPLQPHGAELGEERSGGQAQLCGCL